MRPTAVLVLFAVGACACPPPQPAADEETHQQPEPAAPFGPSGSDDRLPVGDGVVEYLGWPLRVHIDPTTMRVEGGPTIAMQDVRLPLRSELVVPLRTRREAVDDDANTRMLVHADRQTRWDTLLHVLHAAAAAGIEEVGLAVRHDQTLRQFVVALGPLPRSVDDDEPITVEVGIAGYVLNGRRLANEVALRTAAQEHKATHPHLTRATITAGSAIPIQRVVTGLETLASCRLDDAMRGDVVPQECLFWQPTIELAAPS